MSGELIAWASLAVYVVGIFVGLYVCGRVQESPAFAIFWPLMMVLAPIVGFAVWVYERGDRAADHTEYPIGGNDHFPSPPVPSVCPTCGFKNPGMVLCTNRWHSDAKPGETWVPIRATDTEGEK